MINFLVSTNRKAWIEESDNYFIADSFIYQYHKNTFQENSDIKISIASPLWDTKENFNSAISFIDSKYKAYIPIISKKLNEIHCVDESTYFWQKCLSFGIIRYITFVYQIYCIGNTYYNNNLHHCKKLSIESYYTPEDFNDNRDFFQFTSYGQEQLFSLYLNFFFPLENSTYNDTFKWPVAKPNNKNNLLSKFRGKNICAVFNIMISRILTCYSRLFKLKITIGILGCFFSSKNLLKLNICSNLKIATINKNFRLNNINIDNNMRAKLSNCVLSSDQFDKFFFYTLKYCFPKEFLENYKTLSSVFDKMLNPYKNIKYVISETWTSDTYSSIAVSKLQKQGVKHIYNEHNYLGQQFIGKSNKYLIPLSDIFVSLGWSDSRIPNLIKGASLFDFGSSLYSRKSIDILFIDGISFVKLAEFNAGYGDHGAHGAKCFIEFNKIFFENLSEDVIRRIVYRPYPKEKIKAYNIENQMCCYDFSDYLNKAIHQVKSIEVKSINSKKLISKSKLVIINYLSTSYLEALIQNIPTVIFWNNKSWFIDDEYNDFYDLLISVGICQTDPIAAAKFIEKISGNPEEWWFDSTTQKAKNAFLEKNIGNPKTLINYLLNLSNYE